MLEPGDAVDRLVVAGRVLLSLSSGGKYLRGWSLKDGTLLWEAVTYTAAAPSAEAAMERGADRGVDLLPLGRVGHGRNLVLDERRRHGQEGRRGLEPRGIRAAPGPPGRVSGHSLVPRIEPICHSVRKCTH